MKLSAAKSSTKYTSLLFVSLLSIGLEFNGQYFCVATIR